MKPHTAGSCAQASTPKTKDTAATKALASGTPPLCRGSGGNGRGSAQRAFRRALVHQPLQRERGGADDEQGGQGKVVVAVAVEDQAAHPGAEERAELVREERHAEERVEVREAEHAADD